MNEDERVQSVYEAYESDPGTKRAWSGSGNQLMVGEFHAAVLDALLLRGTFPSNAYHLLDVGCGTGSLLAFLAEAGAAAENLHGVDLLPSYVAAARTRLPEVDIRVADARELPYENGSQDTVVLATVLSSVLSQAYREVIAREALRVLKPSGAILVYDVRLPNPRNPNVRTVRHAMLRQLFLGCAVSSRSLTLLPPLSRRLGSAAALYPLLAKVPLLRSHLFTIVTRPDR